MTRAIGSVAGRPHFQTSGDPTPTHGRLGSQPPRHLDFLSVTLASLIQGFNAPPASPEFLGQDSFCFRLGRFLSFAAAMMHAEFAAHLLEQFRAELFVAQTPAAPQRFRLRRIIAKSPQFHLLFKLRPSGFAVTRDSKLPARLQRFADYRSALAFRKECNCQTTGRLKRLE